MIRVLVVEDSMTARAMLVRLLEETPGIEVVGEALNGHQAVEMAARLRPDLVTMDVMMPDMDGVEATHRIMAHRPTPILIVTAFAGAPESSVVFEAMKAGALDVVAKPVGFGNAGDDADIADIADLGTPSTSSASIDRASGDEEWGHELVAKIIALAGTRCRPAGGG